MYISKNAIEIRVFLYALLFSLGVIAFALYNAYGEEVKEKITEIIVEYFPE